MNRKSFPMLTIFAMLLLSTLALSITTNDSYAQDLASTFDVKVNHLVTLHDSGFVTINDTVTLSKKPDTQPQTIADFQLGFPHQYKYNVYQIFAFDSQVPQQRLSLELDTGLGKEGFYGVKVHFLEDVDLNNEEPFSFTLVYEFSGLATESISDVFFLDFPVYPSLTQEASVCDTIVLLPPNANYTTSTHNFTLTSSNTLILEKKPLDAFTSEVGRIRFTPETSFSLLNVDEVKRKIVLNEWNELLVSDLYAVTSSAATDASTVWAFLPKNALGINAKDDVGNNLTINRQIIGNATKVTVTLKSVIKQNQTAYLLLSFKLPWKSYMNQTSWTDYTLSFRLFEPGNMTVKKVNVAIDLPEGSEFQSSTPSDLKPDLIQNGVYGKTVVHSLNNISTYQEFDVTINYKHVVFWSSFRITLWTGALVAVVGAVAFIWNTRKAEVVTSGPTTTLSIHPNDLRNYVKAYEEQRKILKERESLEAQARKGKIPRRLYKVRSRTLDSRVSLLSRDLATLRDKIRTAGPRYAEMMRQIEIAQTELQGVEDDIKRAETRYKRGEISAAAYHKLLEDYFKRRDRAQTNIEGVLLRLREETS